MKNLKATLSLFFKGNIIQVLMMARKTVEQSRHSSHHYVFFLWLFSWKRHAKVQRVTTLTPTTPQHWPKWTLDDLWTPLGMSNLTLQTLFCVQAVLFCFQIFPNIFQNSKYSVWVIPRYVKFISSESICQCWSPNAVGADAGQPGVLQGGCHEILGVVC